MPHPFPVLGKGAGFDFAFFLRASRPVNHSTSPYDHSTVNFYHSLLFT